MATVRRPQARTPQKPRKLTPFDLSRRALVTHLCRNFGDDPVVQKAAMWMIAQPEFRKVIDYWIATTPPPPPPKTKAPKEG